METLIDNCGHFRLFLHPGAVLLGESGIVVSFRLVERYKQQAPSSGHVIIEFEDLPDELARQVLGFWRPTE